MKAFEEFMRLSEHLDKEGMIIERHGEKIANPAFKKQSMAMDRVLFASRMLRMTPLSKKNPPISFN
jgi:phage terminase small subunit